MKKSSYPCTDCRQDTGCDYRYCEKYRNWFADAWGQFQQQLCHNYWEDNGQSEEKFRYVHPDILRRYLHDGPCGRCGYSSRCEIPCGKYRRWWDAKVVCHLEFIYIIRTYVILYMHENDFFLAGRAVWDFLSSRDRCHTEFAIFIIKAIGSVNFVWIKIGIRFHSLPPCKILILLY